MTDWISNGEAGSSVRPKLNGITNKGNSEDITSGASPVVCDAGASLTLVTSGGTHGDEIVELDDLMFTLDSFARPENYGFRHIIALAEQTEGDDVVRVRLNSGSAILVKDKAGNVLAEIADNLVVLDYVGATAVFEWGGEQWYLNHEDSNTSTTLVKIPIVPSASPLVAKDRLLNLFNNNIGWTAKPSPGTLSVETTGASPLTISHDQYTNLLRSGGSSGTETFSIENVNPRHVGTRHIFQLDTLTAPTTELSLVVTNIKALDGSSVSGVIFDTEGQYILLEAWTTTEWRILRGTATVT